MPEFKAMFRRCSPLYTLHTKLDAWRTVRRYSQWQKSYDSSSSTHLPLGLPRTFPDKPRILFIGTDELQDRSGIIQALEVLADVILFVRSDGNYGQNDPNIKQRAYHNGQRLKSIFIALEEQGNIPDLIIMQSWSDYIEPQILMDIRQRYGVYIINIGMDDRHRWSAVRPLIPALDLALTAAPECVAWYEKEGCPACFFPEASDPSVFYPMPDLSKLYDVGFVGARYGIREKIVNALQQAGVNVTAYGNGWESGRLPLGETAPFFARCKIILGVGTIAHCHDFYALKMRDFDATMSGSMYLTHDNSDLASLFDIGHEIVTYRSLDECIQKARYYLTHDDERETIARQGLLRARREHSWLKRFGSLFECLREGAARS